MKKKANNILIFMEALLVVLFITAGCSKKEQPTPQATQPKPATKASQLVQKQSTSAKAPGVSAPLDFSTMKDPFKPFAVEPAVQKKAKEAGAASPGNLLPIQSYEINKFTVSGIIVGLKENTALIIDPTGRGYVVKEGMLIGNNDGRISRITSSALEVVERYRDANGHPRNRTIKLTLSKKK